LWSWHLGKGYNRERSHLRALLTTLPAAALVVADAGYNGYELARAITTAGVSFLIRMSGKDTLYSERQVRLKKFREGEVLLWPHDARRQGLPPLRVRLIRVCAEQRRDVWLLTNVLDKQRLSATQAARYYRWRWENEVCQADCTSSVSCCQNSCTGYDSGNGVAGIGQMDGATRQESIRRIRMSDNSRRPTPPRADGTRTWIHRRSCAGRVCRLNVGGNWITCSVR
jgi:DDE family transposase